MTDKTREIPPDSPFNWRKTPTSLDLPAIVKEQNKHRNAQGVDGTGNSPYYRLLSKTGLRDYSKDRFQPPVADGQKATKK